MKTEDTFGRKAPTLLDLYCGEGIGADGYAELGFDVVGVDIKEQPNYPYTLIVGDVIAFLKKYGTAGFDVVHSSPPCQAHTTMSNGFRGKGGGNSRVRGGRVEQHVDLIGETRELLQASGVPWVIENVHGARRKMIEPTNLTGGMFGLGVHRPRFFESNITLEQPPKRLPVIDPVGVYGKLDGRRIWTRVDGSIQYAAKTLEQAKIAMGVSRECSWKGLCEGIPPAYTRWIGTQLLRALEIAA